MKSKVLIFITVFILLLSGSMSAFAASDPAQTYTVYKVSGYYDRFVNYVDGYQLNVDTGMNVDMSYSNVGAVLENDTKRVEIYKQNISSSSKGGYINYSNKFLANSTDHVTDYDAWINVSGKDVKLTMWHRAKLARVANDKNYYACIEIPQGSYVYTVFVKSSIPIYQAGEYEYLIQDFSTFAPTAVPYVRTAEEVNLDTRGWNDETLEFYLKYFSTESELTWGIFEPDTSNFKYDQTNYYEKYFEYNFPIWLNYSEFENTYKHPNLKYRLEEAYKQGATLELTLQTRHAQSNMVYDILDGQYDQFLRDYAKVIAEFDHPVMFRLFNEMNGDWCPYSSYHTSKDTMIFKEVYKYVHEIFEQEGANANTLWIWNPNSVSFPNFNWNHSLMYYPGDEYVDIVGMTAYNTGNYYPGEKWQEFENLYTKMYNDYCNWFKQPLIITEFSSASAGGDKAKWIDNMFATIEKFDRIKVAIWWDGCDWDANGNIARSYFLDESQAVMKAFKKGLTYPWHLDVYA